MTLNDEEKALLAKYAAQVTAFKRFCVEHAYKHDTFEEVDFSDLSLGFFIATGVDGDSGTGEPFYDAFRLGSICRYGLQYWEAEAHKTP